MTDFAWLEHKLQQQQEGTYYGSLVSFFHGAGVSLADFSPYQPGDAAKRINWKLSAKHNELWVNKWYADQDVHVDIFLDINTNWSGGVNTSNRSLVQQWLADYMLFAAKHHLQHTTVYTCVDKIMTPVSCAAGGAWVSGFAQRDSQVVYACSNNVYTSHLGDFLDMCVAKKKKRIIILFSDFLDLTAADAQKIDWLDLQHSIVQVPLDVPQLIGKNFQSFFLDSINSLMVGYRELFIFD